MIGPELLAIESERATSKRDCCQVLCHWPLLPRVESGDRPILSILFRPAQNMNRPLDECVPGDFPIDRDCSKDLTIRIKFENSPLVPLTQVKILSIVAEIGSGKVGTGKQRFEVAAFGVAINVTIVIPAYANREAQFPACRNRRPWNPGWLDFANNTPRVRLELVDAPEVT